MPTNPRETRSPTDDASAADLQVLRRFCVPLPRFPGYVALYSLVQSRGTGRRWIRWDGVRPVSRIPSRYRSRALSHSDVCPRREGP